MFANPVRPDACSAWEARLEDYVEGHLLPREAAEVEEHTRNCARCAAALDRARSSIGLLEAAHMRPLPAAGPFFIERVMAAVRRERREQESWRPLELAGWELCWLALAASLILAAFMLRVQWNGPVPANPSVQQSQVQELINVPVSQPVVQDDVLLVASTNDHGR